GAHPGIEIDSRQVGSRRRTVIDAAFVAGNELNTLRSQLKHFQDLIGPFSVSSGGKEPVSFATLDEAIDKLLDTAKKGQTIQRYKGLGEMNPEQLWETTMDPTKRTFLQV